MTISLSFLQSLLQTANLKAIKDVGFLRVKSKFLFIKLHSSYCYVCVVCSQCICVRVYCCKYISITIVQSYTGKYHEFVAVCIVTSAQHE